jgi:PAS domain S-box-containing protein
VLVRDAEGKIQLWNAGAETLYGWTREEAIGKKAHQLLRTEFPRPLPEIDARLAKDGYWQGEVTHRRRDASTVSVASHWVLHHDARGAPVVLEVNNDVTELKRAEASLREAQLQLGRILASSPAVIYSARVSATGPVLEWVSENVTAVMGYPVQSVLRRGWWLDALHPDDRDGVLASLAREPVDDGRSLEYRLRYADGEYHWVRDDSRRSGRGQNHSAEVVGAWLDVTERRSLEAQFYQSQKMEAVGRLAGGVAHDFNNLITVILSYTELLQETMAGTPEPAEDLRQIRGAAEAAARLTQQLLAFTRQQVLQPRVLDLNEVVTRSKQLFTRVLGENIEIVTRLSPALGMVRADPSQLDQVLLNLALNARDAMGQGGRLTIETADVTVDPADSEEQQPTPPGEYVMLGVTDTGIGIDEATRARIFDPFFTTKGTAGSGLGLATVYGIVKQSGGFIYVASEPGRGTTFRLYFPRDHGPADTEHAVGDLDADLRGSGTVLLVEDVKEVRQVTRLVLQRLGCRVLEAANGAAALEVAAAHPDRIDLLLTDVVMPEMSGFELADRIRQQRPAIRLLYMSGYANDAIAALGAADAAVPYLQKPFRGPVLARAVREVLQGG